MPGQEHVSSAVIKTLTYSDIFDYPLKLEEITQFLTVAAGKEKIKKALVILKKSKMVTRKNNFWSLKNREETINLRKEREKFAKKKLIKARKAAKILSFIPSIQFVGVSGSLACFNAKETDDIDLFIITKAQTVWSTRLLSTLLLDILGKRRKKSDREFKDKVCLNMFIAEDALEFKEGDLYLAREVVQLKPLYDRGGSYKALIQENLWWLRSFLPNFKSTQPRSKIIDRRRSLFSIFEPFLRDLQLKYMNSHTRREVLEKNRIFFHPKDVHRKILDQYERRIANLIS